MFIRRHEEQSYTHNLLPEGADKPAVWGFERISEAFVQREESMLQLMRRPFMYAKSWAESFGTPLRGIMKQKAIILSGGTGSVSGLKRYGHQQQQVACGDGDRLL